MKLEATTKGLPPYLKEHLKRFVSQENALTICNYILTYQIEASSLSNQHKTVVMLTLKNLSMMHQNMPFAEMSRGHVVSYLNSLEKPEQKDHEWIGTYNQYLTVIIRFYRWLKYPHIEHRQRIKKPKPAQVFDIAYKKRLEEESYDPSEMWNFDDYLTFIKWCPNRRDRCFMAMEMLDFGGRPSELLKQTIEEMLFQVGQDGRQYAGTMVNGKTGKRALAIIDSIGHLKEWLAEHPMRNNPKAPVFCDMHNGMKRVKPASMYLQFRRYKYEYFPRLLEDPSISEEEKKKVEALLKKPFNPYVFRHSFFTQYGMKHSEAEIRQYGGWKKNSKVPFRYQHFLANTAAENRLKEKGLKKAENELEQPKVKYCPNCYEANPLDVNICINKLCKHVLTRVAYDQAISDEKKLKTVMHWLTENFDQLQKSFDAGRMRKED